LWQLAAAMSPSFNTAFASLSETELAERVRAGDVMAFEVLYERSFTSLWRFAYSYVRSRDVANEVVQDVFVAVWELGATWRVDGSVRAYLFRAVRNRALNVRKHDTRMARFEERAIAEDDAPALGESPPLADATMLLEERQAMIAHAVARLPDRWQRAVTLRTKDQLSYEDIGVVLEISTDAARMLVARAQRELRHLLAPYLDDTDRRVPT
jgi:RNA polymerase sigma factor (sigma-70 family)